MKNTHTMYLCEQNDFKEDMEYLTKHVFIFANLTNNDYNIAGKVFN